MKLTEGDALDDALELFHNHSWVVQKPEISAVQMAELVPVLAPLFQQSRPKVRRQAPPKERPPKRRTNPPTSVVTLVKRRATNADGLQLCEVCGDKPGVNTHHRQPRGMGGSREEHINTTSNLLWVCGHGNTSGCHATIENGRVYAKDVGWLVPRPTLPIDVPVLRRGVLVYLDDQGSFDPAQGKVA